MENHINQDKAMIAIVTHGEELWGAERLRRILSEAGLRVLGVDAGEAQSAFQKSKPNLVIANLAGGSTGDLELCQKLSRLSQAPIIAIGLSTDEDTIVSMIETVVDDYMVRPVNPQEMVARVRSILRRTPAGAWSKTQITTLQKPQLGGRPKKRFQSIFHSMQRWVKKYRSFS